MLSRRLWYHRRGKPLSPVYTGFPASQALSGPRARVLPAPHEPSLAPIVRLPGDRQPRRYPVATWLAPETLAPLWPIGKNWHTLRPTQGGPRACPGAGARLRGILFPLPAFAVTRNSFLP